MRFLGKFSRHGRRVCAPSLAVRDCPGSKMGASGTEAKHRAGAVPARRGARVSGPAPSTRPAHVRRQYGFERLEPRIALAADIHLGVVYYEPAAGFDAAPNTFTITFKGGAPGTQLVELVIDTDKEGNGLTIGDVLFDTAPGGLGAFASSPLTIVSHDGFQVMPQPVADGSQRLVLRFSGFDPGERLVFTIDVDEQGFLGQNAVAEGNEFEGSRLYATFSAPHYYDAVGSDMFLDAYDFKLLPTGLDLPHDDYVPPNSEPSPVLTAGAVITLTQVPLPISLAGTVFEDLNANNVRDPEDPPLSGVTLTLYRFENGAYVPTGLTTATAGDGAYRFDHLAPGRYRVVQTQPEGYLSVGARAGTVAGQVRGVVASPDILTEIDLAGGEDSLHNDFAEVRPATLCGYVYHDVNDNGLREAGEQPIAGAQLHVQNMVTGTSIAVWTDDTGLWCATGLPPGEYRVVQVQPSGYLDGRDTPGTLGGTAVNPGDRIEGIHVLGGQHGREYNFGELLPASLSGTVHIDRDGDCVRDPDEPRLAGVVVQLLDAQGEVLVATTTDFEGRYRFDNLVPGVYGIRELQPAGYFSGKTHIGTAGGAVTAVDTVTGIRLFSRLQAAGYDFCEIEPASISGRVIADLNGNCVLDPGEQPLAGVELHLLDAAGNLLAVTHTDAQGQYRFGGLRPGVYQVRELQPAGYFDGPDHVGTEGGILLDNDLISEIRLLPGRQALHYDFCELPGATLSGYVFVDGAPIEVDDLVRDVPPILDNLARWRDGLRTPDDTPLAGVRLLLADAAGQLLLDARGRPIEAVTNAQGFYQFGPLPPGLYTVIQVQPSGYVSGFNLAGSTGGVPFGRVPEGGAVVAMGWDIAGLDLEALAVAIGGRDAIALIPLTAGQASVENNFSEVLFVGVVPRLVFPPPLTPPPPFVPPPAPLAAAVLRPSSAMVLPVPEPLPYGRGGYVQNYTWHLSIIDAGYPRGVPHPDSAAAGAGGVENQAPVLVLPGRAAERVWHEASLMRSRLARANWNEGPDDAGRWTLLSATSGSARRLAFGLVRGLPVTGDFNGDGVSDVGIFVDGMWYIDLNGNGRWDDDDLWVQLGSRDDLPITGDWDGDGKTDIGIFGPIWPADPRAIAHEPGLPAPMNHPASKPKNLPPPPQEATSGWRILQRTREGDLRADLIDHVFHYGEAGDIPVSGDWTGAGLDAIGVFRGGTWILDTDGDGRLTERDMRFELGQPGDRPIVGDFNGDGIDELGVYRHGRWYIDINRDRVFDERDLVIEAGGPNDLPVVGDWDGDGIEQPGFYTPETLGVR